MSAKNRIPNRLKFSLTYGDRSKIEGTVKCSDAQGQSIMRVLFPNYGADEGIAQAFAQPTPNQNKDTQ